MSRAAKAQRSAPPPRSGKGLARTTRWDDTLRQAMRKPGYWYSVEVPSTNHSMGYRLKRIAERLGGVWQVTSRGINEDPAGMGSVWWRYLGPVGRAMKPTDPEPSSAGNPPEGVAQS